MRINLFTSLLSVLIILCLQGGVNADYCADDVTAGKCFRENIVPFVIGATTAGFVFGFFLLILSLCLFCNTKVKNGDIDWVHDREPSNWVRDVQGTVNNGHQFEPRNQGLGDNKPQHFVSDRSLYSERATTFPSSNASDIMGAMDEIEDTESRAPSGYYWAYGGPRDGGARGGSVHGGVHGGGGGGAGGGGARGGGAGGGARGGGVHGVHGILGGDHGRALPEKERGSEYETITSSKNVHSAQILHHKKSGSTKIKDLSSNDSTITN